MSKPSYRPGVSSDHQPILVLLNRIDQPLTLHTLLGGEIHRNRALSQLLDGDPGAATGLVRAISRSVRRLLTDPTSHSGESRYRCYDICTVGLPATLLGVRSALAQVHSPPKLPSGRQICARSNLTEREAEVALLMALGLTGSEIATRLGIKPNTARRHSEQVLLKLGLHSRAAVAVSLLSL